MTRQELIRLLEDADEQVRNAIQNQRGIGIDQGIPDNLARQRSNALVRKAIGNILKILPAVQKPASAETAEIRGIGERLDAGKLQLDMAGWNSHEDAGVWWLGYHQNGVFRVLGSGFPKSRLVSELLPLLQSQGLTPYITREQLGRWVPVWPGAY